MLQLSFILYLYMLDIMYFIVYFIFTIFLTHCQIFIACQKYTRWDIQKFDSSKRR